MNILKVLLLYLILINVGKDSIDIEGNIVQTIISVQKQYDESFSIQLNNQNSESRKPSEEREISGLDYFDINTPVKIRIPSVLDQQSSIQVKTNANEDKDETPSKLLKILEEFDKQTAKFTIEPNTNELPNVIINKDTNVEKDAVSRKNVTIINLLLIK